MKKSLLFLVCLGLTSFIHAQTSKTIVNISAGHLCDSISSAEKQTISKLILTGTIDVRDFVTMRDSMPALSDIDISGTSVIAFTGFNANNYYLESENTIPKFSFANTSNLKSITLPSTLSTIEYNAFSNCSNLETITFPSTITSIGFYAFENCKSLKTITLPASLPFLGVSIFQNCVGLKKVIFSSAITEISDFCFSGCISLDSITIPTTVKLIGPNAFSLCDSLKTIKFMEGVEIIENGAFRECKSLKNIEFPNSIKKIENDVFVACLELESAIFPKSLEIVGSGMFFGCSNLTYVKLPDSLTVIPDEYFRYCIKLKNIKIPSKVKSIGWNAFSNCSSLESISIPDSVNKISEYAFSECKNLKSITLPDSISSIQSNTFNNCSNLLAINLKEGVITIKNSAFNGCSKLSSIDLPSTLKTIESHAFWGNDSLFSIQIPTSVSNIQIDAISRSSNINVDLDNQTYSSIDGVLFNKSKTMLIQYPNNKKGDYIIPTNVSIIDTNAFYNCVNLTKIIVPQSVISIQSNAFYNCTSIKSLKIPSNISTIGYSAFESCKGLTSIIIASKKIGPSAFKSCLKLDTVKLLSPEISIDNLAFAFCSKIDSIFLYSEIPPSVSAYTFNLVNITKCSLFVPTGKIASYQSNNIWVKFIIKEMGGLSLSTSSIDLASSATNNSDIKITADTSWTASSNQTWLSLDNKSGLKGSSTLSFSVSANTGTNRTAEITITALGSAAKIIKINQASGNGEITVSVKAGEFLTTLNNGLYNSTKELIITGTLNALDFQYIRSMPALTKIDLSGATIENNILPDYALAGNSTLTTVVLPSTITSINPYAFNYCTNLTSITIPSSVTSIGISAFIKCTALSSIELPESVSTISNTAFQFCSGLTSFKIPSSVDTIMDSTFYGCTGLKSIIIPSSVTYVGNMAFADCKNIDTIYSYPVIPALTGSYRVFDGVDTNKCVLLVPFDTKSSYQKANAWKDFKNVKEFGGFWLSDSTISLTNTEGSSIKIALKTNGTWSISNTASWLTISPTSGTGSDTITVIAKANNTGVSRSSELLITSSDAVSLKGQIEKTIKIEQLGTQTAIETINSEEVSIYPNPANASFNINTDKHSFVELYSIEGTLLYAIQTSSTITNISTNNLGTGLYIIKITNDSKTIIKHLVIENK